MEFAWLTNSTPGLNVSTEARATTTVSASVIRIARPRERKVLFWFKALAPFKQPYRVQKQ
jgi:hypothetical protein